MAVLVSAAYASGLAMIMTNRPVGAEALLPVGASGDSLDSTNVLGGLPRVWAQGFACTAVLWP